MFFWNRPRLTSVTVHSQRDEFSLNQHESHGNGRLEKGTVFSRMGYWDYFGEVISG